VKLGPPKRERKYVNIEIPKDKEKEKEKACKGEDKKEEE
jgi:hypothetical protein